MVDYLKKINMITSRIKNDIMYCLFDFCSTGTLITRSLDTKISLVFSLFID